MLCLNGKNMSSRNHINHLHIHCVSWVVAVWSVLDCRLQYTAHWKSCIAAQKKYVLIYYSQTRQAARKGSWVKPPDVQTVALTFSSRVCVCRSSVQHWVFVWEEPLHMCGQCVWRVYLHPGPVAVWWRQRLRGPQWRGRMQWVHNPCPPPSFFVSLWLTLCNIYWP